MRPRFPLLILLLVGLAVGCAGTPRPEPSGKPLEEPPPNAAPEAGPKEETPVPTGGPAHPVGRNDFERAYLHRMMVAARGNVSRASRNAGKERRAFGRLLKKHGIDRLSYQAEPPSQDVDGPVL